MKLPQIIKDDVINLYKTTNLMFKEIAVIINEKHGTNFTKVNVKGIVCRYTDFRRPKRNDYKYKTTPEIQNFIKYFDGTRNECIKAVQEKYNILLSNNTIQKYRDNKGPSRIKYSQEEKEWLNKNIPNYSMQECSIAFEKEFGRKIKPTKYCYTHGLKFNNCEQATDAIIDIIMDNLSLENNKIIELLKDSNINQKLLEKRIKELKLKYKKEILDERTKWLNDNKSNYHTWVELTKAFNEHFGTNYANRYFTANGGNRSHRYKHYEVDLNIPFKEKDKKYNYYTKVNNARNIYENYYNVQIKDEHTIFHIDGNKNNTNIGNLIELPYGLISILKRKNYTGDLALCYVNLYNLKKELKGEAKE